MNNKEEKSKALEAIATAKTLLEHYPILTNVNSFKSINVSADPTHFIIEALKTLGAYEELVDWLSRYLVTMLPVLETVIKTVLKTNLKNTVACSINPFIPDKDPNDVNSSDYFSDGITVDLGQLDLTGMLRTCPLDKKIGRYFYFGTENMIAPSQLVNAIDFNAFLYYIINNAPEYVPLIAWNGRGGGDTDTDWDGENDSNSNGAYGDSYVANDENRSNTWTNLYSASNSGKTHPIAILNFEEKSFPFNNVLRFRISSYYKDKHVKTIDGVQVKKNAMIFEFNNDYINSIKLFDAKVVAAQLIDNLTGALSFNAGYSIEDICFKGKIDQIIKRVLETPDTEINDCWFSFSNKEYDELLEKATLQHAGLFKYSGEVESATSIDPQALFNTLSGMSENATLQEQTTIIKNAFIEVSGQLGSDDIVESRDKFSFRLNIISQLIRDLAAVVVKSILSPKIYLLFIVNAKLMGKLSAPNGLKDIPAYFEEFLESSMALLTQIILEVRDEILKSLFEYLLEQLKPLAALLSSKLVVESNRYYMELLAQLIKLMSFNWGARQVNSNIANVDYADILPVESAPKESTC